MSNVPADEKSLNAGVVLAIVRDQFPEIRAETAEPLAGGTDYYTYLVDKEWVFKFPKGRDTEFRLEVELAVLQLIGSDSPLPLPTYRFRGKVTPLFGYDFGGYAFLSGQ